MTDRSDASQKTNQKRRLSAALRENLKRRKAQARARQEGDKEAREQRPLGAAAQQDPDSHDSAGIPDDKQPSGPG